MSDAPPPPAAPRTDAAVRRHEARLRPWRIAYIAGIVVAALVLVVIVKIAYSVGEISHATLHTVAKAPARVPLAAPSPQLTRTWTTDDATALGYPYDDGTVVTWDAHTVHGRNARTGAITWSYTRTDRTVCTAMQTEGVTIAVYALNGNCDELTGLDTGTGDRRWTRTLDKDSNKLDHAIDGRPNFAVGPYSVMIWTSHVMYSINPSGDQDTGNKNGGLDRWVFAQQGCTIDHAVLGTSGVLISQTCANRDCTGLKFCGNGPQLLLRDPDSGENTDSSTNKGNPDQVQWNLIGSKLLPASADAVVSAISPDGTLLTVLSTQKGVALHRLALSGGGGSISATATDDSELIQFSGMTYAVQANRTAFVWQSETTALPTVISTDDDDLPTLNQARLSVPTTTGIATLNPADGTPSQRFTTIPAVGGSRAYPFGTGFLMAGPETEMFQ